MVVMYDEQQEQLRHKFQQRSRLDGVNIDDEDVSSVASAEVREPRFCHSEIIPVINFTTRPRWYGADWRVFDPTRRSG